MQKGFRVSYIINPRLHLFYLRMVYPKSYSDSEGPHVVVRMPGSQVPQVLAPGSSHGILGFRV